MREFRLSSAEGLPIRASVVIPQAPRGLVFVVHGFKGFREWGCFPWLTEQLAAGGYAACRFDMSRNGVGEDCDTFERLDLFENDTFSIQLSDLDRVISAVTAEKPFATLPVFLLGHSRGGAIATLGARNVAQLSGVITWGSISHVDRWDGETVRRWRADGYQTAVNQRTGQQMRVSTAVLDDCENNRGQLDVLAAASSLSVPMLILHGTADETVAPEESRQIASVARDSTLVIIDGATHTFGAMHPLVNIPSPLKLAAALTERFLCANVPLPCIERSRLVAK